MGENYPKWIPHSHIVHFTPESFRRLFMESDFKCEPIVRFYTPFEIYILEFFYKIKRLFRRKIEIDFSKYEEDEFSRDLRFFRVRAAISLIVVKVFGSSQYDGSLMYSCVTKR